MGVTSLAIQFTIVDLLSKGVSSIRDRLQTLSSASQDVKRNFDKMAQSFKYAAIAGIATRELYKGMKPAVSLAGDLQQEMLKTKVELMGAGKNAQVLQNELKAIKASAFSIQAWTPFDMTQIVGLEKELLKAGATVEQVTSKTGAAVAAASLATYEGVDPTETGKALIRIATPFNLTADKFMELADTISKASSASTADLMDIVMSGKYAAGTMANLGRSTKEMAAMSALMAQVGLQGETGGRAIREFFDSATKIGAFKDAKGNLIGTIEMIKKLRQSLKGMGEAERMEKLKKVFGELGSQTAMALLKEGDTSYEALIDSMDKAVGLQSVGWALPTTKTKGDSMLILKNVNEKTLGKEITVKVMGEDISMSIRPLSVDIINSLRKRHRDEKKLNDALIDHVVESFEGIGDEKGEPLEVTLANKKRVMNIAGVDGGQGVADIVFNEAKKLALEVKEEEIKN